MWVYAKAIRHLARTHDLTWDETVSRFGPRLVHVQCNVVTAESVEALIRG